MLEKLREAKIPIHFTKVFESCLFYLFSNFPIWMLKESGWHCNPKA